MSVCITLMIASRSRESQRPKITSSIFLNLDHDSGSRPPYRLATASQPSRSARTGVSSAMASSNSLSSRDSSRGRVKISFAYLHMLTVEPYADVAAFAQHSHSSSARGKIGSSIRLFMLSLTNGSSKGGAGRIATVVSVCGRSTEWRYCTSPSGDSTLWMGSVSGEEFARCRSGMPDPPVCCAPDRIFWWLCIEF